MHHQRVHALTLAVRAAGHSHLAALHLALTWWDVPRMSNRDHAVVLSRLPLLDQSLPPNDPPLVVPSFLSPEDDLVPQPAAIGEEAYFPPIPAWQHLRSEARTAR